MKISFKEKHIKWSHRLNRRGRWAIKKKDREFQDGAGSSIWKHVSYDILSINDSITEAIRLTVVKIVKGPPGTLVWMPIP